MAKVNFTLDIDFDASPRSVFDALIDWKGHESWIPSTIVELHGTGDGTAIGDEFTAWTGLGLGTRIGRMLALEDRMRVDVLHFDEANNAGECKVTKLGSPLSGIATFTVRPLGEQSDSSRLQWAEDVEVAYAPQFLAPLLGAIGKAGFSFGMKRLGRQLRAT